MSMGWLKTRVQPEETFDRPLAPVISLERRTLAQRLEEGSFALSDGLRVAADLAQTLRGLHDEGRAHGALTPLVIELTGSGIQLLPVRSPRGVPTPYTAPEVLQGQAPDARSDMFSFGAILFEIVTGRWPFEGETPEALATAIQNDPVPQCGNSVVESLIRHCLTKDPAARLQIRKAQLELKLASVSARRAEDSSRRDQFGVFVRSEIQSALDLQVAGTLESQQKALVEVRQTVALSAERMNRVERALDAADRHVTEFAGSAAAQLHALEQTVRAQAAALESARQALAQTDDLVERVVEAMDSLQSIVLERTEFIPGAISVHNGRHTVRQISG